MTAERRSRNNRGTHRIKRQPSGGIIVEVVLRSAINGDSGRKRFVCANERRDQRNSDGGRERKRERVRGRERKKKE